MLAIPFFAQFLLLSLKIHQKITGNSCPNDNNQTKWMEPNYYQFLGSLRVLLKNIKCHSYSSEQLSLKMMDDYIMWLNEELSE